MVRWMCSSNTCIYTCTWCRVWNTYTSRCRGGSRGDNISSWSGALLLGYYNLIKNLQIMVGDFPHTVTTAPPLQWKVHIDIHVEGFVQKSIYPSAMWGMHPTSYLPILLQVSIHDVVSPECPSGSHENKIGGMHVQANLAKMLSKMREKP